MKKNKFESFVKENKSAFDLKEPRQELWYEIDKKIPRKKGFRIFRMNIMGIAASVVLLLGLGIAIGFIIQVNSSENLFYAQSSEYGNFPEVEKYYLMQIKDKTSELEEMGVKNSIEENLEQLDEIYAELREEFLYTEDKNKEVLINAMIRNYQTKIDILELILGRSKQAIQQQKTKKNETINI